MTIPLDTIIAAIVALREVAAMPYEKETWELSTRCLGVAQRLELCLALESAEIVAAPTTKEHA